VQLGRYGRFLPLTMHVLLRMFSRESRTFIHIPGPCQES
jgi:hypothetical protein